MIWTKKRAWDDPPATRVEAFISDGVAGRVAKMSTPDLYSWAEVGVSGIGRALSDAQHRQDPAGLHEAQQGAAVLLQVVSELTRREAVQSLVSP